MTNIAPLTFICNILDIADKYTCLLSTISGSFARWQKKKVGKTTEPELNITITLEMPDYGFSITWVKENEGPVDVTYEVSEEGIRVTVEGRGTISLEFPSEPLCRYPLRIHLSEHRQR